MLHVHRRHGRRGGEELHGARQHGELASLIVVIPHLASAAVLAHASRDLPGDAEPLHAARVGEGGLPRARLGVRGVPRGRGGVVEEDGLGLHERGVGQVVVAEPLGRVVEVHEEVVVVDVDRQLEGLGHLVVAEQVVEELARQVVDLVREFVESLQYSNTRNF